MANLDEAIRSVRKAVAVRQPDHNGLVAELDDLGIQLGDRFESTGALADLEDVIVIGRAVITETPQDHPDRARRLINLSIRLGDRFDKSTSMADLEEAIHFGREAIHITPEDDPGRAGRLTHLSSRLGMRFQMRGAIDDLEQSICIAREAVHITTHDNHRRHRVVALSNLANRLAARFQATGAVSDLEDAIHIEEEVVVATPLGNPNRIERLNNLGILLGMRFQRTGKMSDLNETIQIARQSVDATTRDHPERADRLSNLSVRLGDKFERTGAMTDLEEAIHAAQEAVDLTPQNHPDCAGRLDNLGIQLGYRFRTTGAMADLEEATRVTQAAVDITSVRHPSRGGRLVNLSILLGAIHERTRAIIHLEKSVHAAREALNAFSPEHPSRSSALNNLGNRLADMFERTGTMAELEEAILFSRAAVESIPGDHPDRAGKLNNLGLRLAKKYERTKVMADLDEAIYVLREAVNATPLDSPGAAGTMFNLGAQLVTKFETTGAETYIETALDLFTRSLEFPESHILDRFWAGDSACKCYAYTGDWKNARATAHTVLKLLPRLLPRWLSRDDQQHVVKDISTFSSLAASCVLQAGGTPAEALETLEIGRGVIASFTMDFRSDVSMLKEQQPSLFAEYDRLRTRVSSPVSIASSRETGNGTSGSHLTEPGNDHIHLPMSQVISRRQNDIKKLEEIESEIRKTLGFERFLLPPSSAEVIALSAKGPIVAFNVTQHRSDAILVTEAGVSVLALPELGFKQLVRNVNKLIQGNRLTIGKVSTKPKRQRELKQILKWLWEVAVGPVLQFLGLLSPLPSTSLPHVWWIASGYMAFTPIHAAGDSNGVTLDYVVSSYIPSIRALKYTRERECQPLRPDLRMLIVSMPDTIGMCSLKTGEEATAIAKVMDPIQPVILTKPSKTCVLNEIRTSHIVHFACHGESDEDDPSASKLFLGPGTDGNAEQLSIRELAHMRQDARIAYLSACCTAQNNSVELSDEVIHLASTFQLIGFPHVIGTFWEVSDKAAIEVAESFYSILMKNLREDVVVGKEDAVAIALHHAVRGLRQKKPTDVFSWVPFIHVGP